MSDEPMFTAEELALLDTLVNPAKWALLREIHERMGGIVDRGGDQKQYQDATRLARERFGDLDALSAKVMQRRREAAQP